MALRNQPYLPLYVQDFMSDEKLRECSAESVGVYIFLMCVMHKSDEYGKVALSNKYICLSKNQAGIRNFASMLAKHLPFTIEVIERSLDELLREKVIQLEGNCLVQKRMVKDCKTSEARALSGGKGGKKRVDNLTNISLSKNQANNQANSENEYDIVNEDVNDNNKKDKVQNKISKKLIDEFYETIWKLYPRKEGKGQVSTTQKEKLYAYGVDEITRAIERYKRAKAGVEQKYLQQGSTFFNSGYIDYLDENYNQEPEKENYKVIQGGIQLI